MSATSDIRVRPPAVLLTSRPRATRTFFVWLGLCLLGFPLGGYLGYFVFGAVDGVKPAVFGGALTGAGIGFAQWVLLRRYLGTGPEWIVATSVALAAGLAIGAAVVGYETTVSALAIMGVISGAFVGLAQGPAAARQIPALARVDRRDAGAVGARLARDRSGGHQRGGAVHRVRSLGNRGVRGALGVPSARRHTRQVGLITSVRGLGGISA